MSLGDKYIENITFVEMVFGIVLGWIIVTLWQRCLDNFTFNYLGLNRASTYQTGIIAFTFTILFVSFIFIFQNLSGGIIEQSIGNDFSAPTVLKPVVPQQN